MKYYLPTSSLANGQVTYGLPISQSDLHGDLFEFNRNAIFNARNHFATVRDQLKRNQFGGVIGGPIIRDKTFFFAGYQQTQLRDTQNGHVGFVPSAAELAGDFSAVPTQIFNPTTKALVHTLECLGAWHRQR